MARPSHLTRLLLVAALVPLVAPSASARKQVDEVVERAIKNLERGVKSGDFDTRALAVRGLGHAPKKEALPLVKDALADPQWKVRRAAIEALGDLKEKRLWEQALLAAIADVKIDADTGVMPLLAPLGPKKGVDMLMKALRDPKFPKPERYAAALARLGGDWMVTGYKAALKLLKGESRTPFEVEYTKLRLPDALPLYKDKLDRQEIGVQKVVLDRIEALDGKIDVGFLKVLLRSKDEAIAFQTAALLARHGNAAGKGLLVEAAKGQDEQKQLAALVALSPIASADLFDIVRPIVKDRSANIDLLLAAYRIFFKGGNPKLAAYLENELTNTDVNMRAAAVAFIGEVKGHAAISDLVPLLGAGPLVIRVQAAGSLGRLGQRDAIPALRDALNVAHETEFKVALLDALADIKDAEILDVVRFYIQERDADVRRAAVRAIVSVPTDEGLRDLEQVLSDRDREIRTMALRAIVERAPDRFIKQYEQALTWIEPSFVSDLADQWKGKARPHVELALDSSRDEMRSEGLRALKLLPKVDQLAVLAGLVKDAKREEMRLVALTKLVEVQGKDALPLVVELATSGDAKMRVAALAIIGERGGKEQDALLRGLVDDSAEAIRVAASSALLSL
ncbi:MAG: hypothetical protein CVU56_10335 [Deltaproteobacteria bacterium HGW-Deltaproteobacteria-14]|jgi:HEAT repeat protein|nr:MAG: hypothetical protein CVU56_10335 [Deltaproteobacteria bacterium HGW-Deltaproteobacteria-14]